jgi:RNA polymerase sigma-70 factor (ECF subfamily)
MTSEAANSGDADLIHRAQAGDDLAFEQLVSRHYNALFGLAFFLTGERADAEDIVQETLLAAYQRLSGFEARSSFKTWASRILVNQAARHHRSRKVRERVTPLKLSEESRAILSGKAQATNANEIRLDVLQVLETLTPEHREVIVLRELEGMSYAEIAEVLNIPEGTVESRLFRARQEMKELLKDYLD